MSDKRLPKTDAPRVVLGSVGNVEDVGIPYAISFVVYTTAKKSDLPVLEQVVNKAMAKVVEVFAKDEFTAYIPPGGEMRPVHHSEVGRIKVVKLHMVRVPGAYKPRQLCQTQYVSQRNMTEDWEQVTCESCLEIADAKDRR